MRSGAKKGRANADQGGALFDGNLKITRHAHGQFGELNPWEKE